MNEEKKYSELKDCVARVAVLAFGCTLEEFVDFATPNADDRYYDTEFVKFALSKGYFVGVVFMNPYLKEGNRVLEVAMNIKDNPAYVVVKENGNVHAVYWDGEKIVNPDPMQNKGLELYNILAWYPILKIN